MTKAIVKTIKFEIIQDYDINDVNLGIEEVKLIVHCRVVDKSFHFQTNIDELMAISQAFEDKNYIVTLS